MTKKRAIPNIQLPIQTKTGNIEWSWYLFLKYLADKSESGGGAWGEITGDINDQTDLKEALDSKQDKLIAGANITIAADGKTISATDTIYTAGTNIDITGTTISCTYSLPSNVLTNQSSASNALAAGSGSQASASSTAYGVNAKATSNVTSAFGWASEASGQYSAAFAGKAQGLRSNAFGQGANAKQSYSIQLGEGTNNTANSLQVYSWTLLDNTSGKIPDARLNVIDNTSSTSTTSPLSANMGREMQLEISHLQSIGRFLSFWNCATGLPTTSPQTSPYTYQTGDYFRVGTVATGGASNYKPNGSTYTTGVASTTVETGTVVVGQVYYYDGTNWSLSAGGGTTETDERTVHYNTDNELEVIGVKDQKTGNADKVWTGTLAEYKAIASKDNNTIYNVTDDVVGGVDIYTKAEVDAAFVHKTGTENITGAKKFTGELDIGNIEIVQGQQGYKDIKGIDTNNNRIGVVRFEHTTSNSRSVGLYVVNSQNVNEGGIAVSVESDDTTVHTTAFTPSANSNNRDIATTEWIRSLLGNHYVTEYQAPTSGNNFSWYRKYADGWIEQGGSYNWGSSISNRYTITYPKEMANSINCLYVTRPKGVGDTYAYDNDGVESQSTTGFVSAGFGAGSTSGNSFVWYVCGVAA